MTHVAYDQRGWSLDKGGFCTQKQWKNNFACKKIACDRRGWSLIVAYDQGVVFRQDRSLDKGGGTTCA